MTALTGAGSLMRFVLRRDRVYLPVWMGAIVGLTYASVAGVRRTYDSPVEIASYAINIGGSPASVAMAGPPVALDEIGGILVYETSMNALLGVALMSVFLVVRHTRAEEDAGRVELLGATEVSPHAVVAAAVMTAVAASLLVGLGVAGFFLAERQPVAESMLFGTAVAALGVVFAGVAACAAQVMSHARGAIGASLAVLGVAFGVRAVGDVGENAWSWLSPMGWSQQVRVYDDNRWWPLLLSLVLAATLGALTVVLETRRDLGAGLVPPRPGPARAGRLLSGVVGLSWRLQRGAILGWLAGTMAMGLLLGSFSDAISNMVEDNPTLAAYFEQSGLDVVEAYLATSLLLLAIGSSGFAVASALRVRSEELALRAEPVLATAVGRTRWLLAGLLVTGLGTTVVLAAGGMGVGVSYAASTGRPAEVLTMVGAVLAHLPAVAVLAAVAVALIGWAPRAAGAAWAGVVVAFVIGWLGALLGLPPWVDDLSPFTHVPAVPAAEVTPAPLVVLGGLALAATTAGAVGFRRRDLG